MIKTALKTTAVAATITGATFAAAPAHAGVGSGNTVVVKVTAPITAVCNAAAVAGVATAKCKK